MDYHPDDVKTWVREDRKHVIYVIIPGRTGWTSSRKFEKKKAVEWALAQARGGFSENTTLKEFSEDLFIPGRCSFVSERIASGSTVGAKQYMDMRTVLDLYIRPKWGTYLLQAITPSAFSTWLSRLKTIRTNTPLSLSYRKKILGVMNSLMNWALFHGVISANKILSIPKITVHGEKRRAFSTREIAKIFSDPVSLFGSLSWATYFMIAADTGLRPQEVSALHWEDYRPSKTGFLVWRAVDHWGNLKGLKTDTKGISRRAAILSPKTIGFLELLRTETTPQGLIFKNDAGKPVRVDAALERFKEGLDWLEVEEIRRHLQTGLPEAPFKRDGRTTYSLRHAFNTFSRTTHGDSATRALMGHTSESMTENYDDPDEEDIFGRAKGQGRLGPEVI